MSEAWIGRRISRYREMLGLTQQELADRVGKSRSYVAMIEAGQRTIVRRDLLIDFAEALGVSVADLAGSPPRPRTRDDMYLRSLAAGARLALDEDPDTPGPVRSVGELTRAVDEAMRARTFSDYSSLVSALPDLIRETRLLANSGGPQAVDGMRLFVRAAVTASLAIKPFGYEDLATRLGERAMRAAELAGDEVCAAAATYVTAQAVLAGGCRRRSYQLAATAAAELGDGGGDDAKAWYGLLHLHAALSAGSLGRTSDSESHLEAAASVAPHVAGDPWRMEFSVPNVEVWRVSVALEKRRPDAVPTLAERVDETALRTPNRRSQLHLDWARGLFLLGEYSMAVRHLLRAVEIAPLKVRRRALVEEMVGQIARDARRTPGEELRTLTVRLGIDPLATEVE